MNDKDKITINLLKEQQKFINDNQHLIIEDNHQNLFLDNQEDIFPSLSTIFALLMAFLCVVGTITNTLSLIIFAKASSRRRSINVLLCGLSASDLCLCILALPVFSLAQLQHLIPGLQPSLANHLLVFCYPLCLMAQTMSVWMLVGITIDRWLAVCYPFSIRIHCTVKRARLIVLGTFLFSLFYNLVRFWEYRIDTNGEIVGLLRDDYLFMLLYQNLATTLSQFLLPLCVLCPLNLQVARAILAARERRKNMLWTELSSVEANSREQSTAAMMLVVVLACLPGNPKTCPLTCPPGCHCVVAGNSCCFPASSIQYNFWERIKNQPQQNSNNMGNLNNGNQLNNYLLMLLLLRQQQQGGGGLFNNNNGNYFGGCQDQAANCVSFSPLCFFSTKMLIFCPSTCGICQLNNPQFIQQRLLQILFGGQQQQGLNNNNFGQFGGGGGGNNNNNNLPSNGNQQQLSPYGSNTFGQIQSFLDNAQGIANQVSGVANSANTALGTIGGSGLNLQTLGQALGQRLGLG